MLLASRGCQCRRYLHRHTHLVLLGDRFELPGGPRVGLRHLVGFTLQLVQDPRCPSPVAYDLLERAGRDLADSVAVGLCHRR